MAHTFKSMRLDKDILADALRQAGADVSDHKKIKCPWHDDGTASAHLFQPENSGGAWKFRCFACDLTMDVFDVMAKNKNTDSTSLMAEMIQADPTLSDDYQPTPTVNATVEPKKPKVAADTLAAIKSLRIEARAIKGAIATVAETYSYTNPDTGLIDLLVARFDPKDFRQFHQREPGGPFYWGKGDGLCPLYNRTRVRRANTVVVVEGERDVHTLADCGIVATTSPAGASNAEQADWSPLSGKNVIFWPDNDKPGRSYVKAAQKILADLKVPPASMSMIDPDELGIPEKEDATWFVNQHGALSAAERSQAIGMALESAKSLGASNEVRARLDEIISGKRQSIQTLHHLLSKLSQLFLPQTITMVCGSAGASKSFFVQEMLMGMHFNGVNVDILHIEDDVAFHLRRALAQLSCNSNITDEEWVRKNPAEAVEIYDRFKRELDSFGARITDIPGQTITYDEVLAWCRKKSESGSRVLAIDPITLADPGKKKPWEADRDLMSGLKSISVEFKNSILLVTHPPKESTHSTSNEMAGGASMKRLSHTILWLEHHAEPITDAKLRTRDGIFPPPKDQPINRTVRMNKTRNGKGQGVSIGFFFDPQTLKSHELGIILPESKRRKTT